MVENLGFWAEVSYWLHFFIGSDADTIHWWQMCIRGILIFFYALLLVRIGGRRVFGKNTSFDIVLGVVLGSILSRALTANARFIPTLAAATTLVALHRTLAHLAFYGLKIGHLIKGTEVQLIKDGKPLWRNMKHTNVTEHDLYEALRVNAATTSLQRVKAAYLERNGDISFII